jgi:hypothetical protein
MRNWLFHPLIFYPLALLVAAGVILFSLEPQRLPRDPAPVAGQVSGDALVLEGAAFNSPTGAPEQAMTVVRDIWGRPQSLRIAVQPGLSPPTAAETGIVIALAPESAALLEGKPLTVEIAYRPLPVNAASALAIRVQNGTETPWVSAPIPPQAGSVRFELPAASGVAGIGLRAVTGEQDQAYGVEITSIRAVPRA